MSRDPQSIVHEIDYWKALLDDLLALNTQVKDAADALIEAPVALVEVSVIASIAPNTRLQDRVAAASKAISETMDVLRTMHEPLDRVLALAEGRFLALRAELDE